MPAQTSLNNGDDGAGTRDRSTVDDAEIEKFARMAEAWWDPQGDFKPLHKFNPTRLRYIREIAIARFGRNADAVRPLEGLRLLDIGCGGGLVCEPMARLGAEVTGIDAAEKNIRIAALHSAEEELQIDYRATTVEALAEAGEAPFDIVLNLEVVEHVADVEHFLKTSARLVAPGGFLAMATINRTLKAFALAKVGAEYVLRWLPIGTHDPRKFVKPEEAEQALRAGGLDVFQRTGVSFQPLRDEWRLSDDMAVNYMLCAGRPS